MRVKLSPRQVGGVTVIDVSGRVTFGEGASSLREGVREMLGQRHKKILLNLGEVSYIDSCGIGELASAFTSATNQAGQLKLLHVTERVRKLLQITRLDRVFEVFEDEAKAVGSFA